MNGLGFLTFDTGGRCSIVMAGCRALSEAGEGLDIHIE
jgi:hypothetical protein